MMSMQRMSIIRHLGVNQELSKTRSGELAERYPLPDAIGDMGIVSRESGCYSSPGVLAVQFLTAASLQTQ